MIHPMAIVESLDIGEGTRIWAFAHVLPGAVIGADCNICDGVFIENDVIVGDRVTVKCGVQLWDGVRLEDDVFVGPNATFTNDKYPRSKQQRQELFTHVRRGASIGANATILPGVVIGEEAMIGAGSVVTHDVAPGSVVAGNPARTMRVSAQKVSPARILLRRAADERGSLAALEHEDLPFLPVRTFIIYSVPVPSVRAQHAHLNCHQFLVCASGEITVETVGRAGDHSSAWRRTYQLDDPTDGLYIPPMNWTILSDFSDDAVLLVMASQPYDPDDYIRDYEEFKALL